MNHALLWSLHLALSLVAFAAALAWASGFPRRAERGIAVAVGLLPLVALAYLTWLALRLRFALHVPHAPWIYAMSLFGASVLGALLLWARRGTATSWSRAGTTSAALGLLVAEAVVLSNLHTAALQRMGDLRIEAGRIAFAALPPRPAPEDNAAPLFVEAVELLRAAVDGDAAVVGWRRWEDELAGEAPLDAGDRELAAYLSDVEPALERARLATELPRMQPAQDGDGIEWLVPPDVQGLIDLGFSLVLRARVRAAGGDAAGACGELAVVQRMSDHLLDTPTLIAVMLACMLRGRVHDEVLRLLNGGYVEPKQAAPAVAQARNAADALVLALRLEEAYALNAIGRLGGSGVALGEGDSSGSGPVARLGEIFLLDAEVRVYRATLAELRARIAEPHVRDLIPASELRSRGLAVHFLIPVVDGMVDSARRIDAKTLLMQAAVLAAARRAATGEYPTTPGQLAELDGLNELAGRDAARYADVRFELLTDGGLRLTHARFPPEDEDLAELGLEVVLSGPRGR